QTPALFSGTIASNIAYGIGRDAATTEPAGVDDPLNGATMAEIERAARLANAHEFISQFPKGYGTCIGESGVQLSGGQRQRIAIARALLKDAPILILDEATSALDAESEAAVQQALERLMWGRTVLVIAHRLSTVVGADKICVVQRRPDGGGGGVVVEEGSHAQLLAGGGVYARLMKTQVSSYTVIGE
ncbi:unnamed protein product, partial [Phaeothamnion confervicola]